MMHSQKEGRNENGDDLRKSPPPLKLKVLPPVTLGRDGHSGTVERDDADQLCRIGLRGYVYVVPMPIEVSFPRITRANIWAQSGHNQHVSMHDYSLL